VVKLAYTKPAIADLHNIFVYISNDSIINARHFVTEIKSRIKTLKSDPEKGRPLFPERYPSIRQVLYKSYRIIYQFDGTTILVLVITHQSRLLINVEAIKKYII
jgi:toxin ParE1/3/4